MAVGNYIVTFTIIIVLCWLISRDKSFLKWFKIEFLSYFRENNVFWILIILTAVITYGFTLTNFAVSVDDEAISSYMNGGLLAQGRFGISHFFQFLVKVQEFIPFWTDFIGVTIIILAIIIWAIYISKITKTNLNKKYFIIFACILLSYPAIAYLFIFMGSAFSIGISFLLVAVSLILFHSWSPSLNNRQCFRNHFENYKYLACVIILAISIGILEWSAVVFLEGIYAGLLFKFLIDSKFSYNKVSSMKNIATVSLEVIATLIFAICVNKSLSVLYQWINGVTPSHYTSNYIMWNLSELRQQLPLFLKNMNEAFFTEFYDGKGDLWKQNLNYAIIIFSALSVFLALRKKSIVPLFIGFCIFISIFSLNIITGNAFLEIRTYVHLGIPISFAFMLLAYFAFDEFGQHDYFTEKKIRQKLVSFTKFIVSIFIFLTILYQTKTMNKLFYAEYLRYEADVRTANNVIFEIEKIAGSLKKPVAFVGTFENSADIKMGYVVFQHDRWQSPGQVVYAGRIIGFLNQLGYSLTPVVNQKDIEKALLVARETPIYPRAGAVQLVDDFVLVHLGN